MKQGREGERKVAPVPVVWMAVEPISERVESVLRADNELLRDAGRLVDEIVEGEECRCGFVGSLYRVCLYCVASELQDRITRRLQVWQPAVEPAGIVAEYIDMDDLARGVTTLAPTEDEIERSRR